MGEAAADAGFSSSVDVCVVGCCLSKFKVRGAGAVPPGRCWIELVVTVHRLGLDPLQLVASGGVEMRSNSVARVRVPSRCWSWYSSYGRVSAGDCQLKIWTPRPIG